jgi:hypothetical protein
MPDNCIHVCFLETRSLRTSKLLTVQKWSGSDVTIPSIPLELVLAFLYGSLSTAANGVHEQTIPLKYK